MKYPLYLMNEEIIAKAISLGATCVGWQKIKLNVRGEIIEAPFSFHFFKSDKKTEVGYFLPDMVCISFGRSSGFTECYRQNGIDNKFFVDIVDNGLN